MALRGFSKKKKRTATTGVVDGGAAQTAVAPAPAAVPELAQAKTTLDTAQQALGGGGATSAREEILALRSQQGPNEIENTFSQQRQDLGETEQRGTRDAGLESDLLQQLEGEAGLVARGSTATEDILGREASIPGGPESGVGTRGSTATEDILGREASIPGGPESGVSAAGAAPGGGVSAAGDPPGSGDIRESIEDRGGGQFDPPGDRTQKFRGREGTTPERDVGIPGGELTEDQWATAGKDGGTTPIRRRTYTSPNAEPIGESRFSVRDKETGEIIQEGAIEDIFPQHDIFDAPGWLDGESKSQWDDINQQIKDLIDGWEGKSEKARRLGGGPTSDGTTREMSSEDFRAKSSIEETIKMLQEKQKSIIGTSIPPDQKAGTRGPDGLEATELPEDQTPAAGDTAQDQLSGAVQTNVEEGSAGERLAPDGEGGAGETGGDVTPEGSAAESDLGEGTTFSAETSPKDYQAFIEDLGSLASASILEGASAGDIENLGQNKKVNEFLDKVMDWDPELSSEEKGAIRSRIDKGIQAAVSKLSGAGMGLSSETVKAIAQGEIMFELEVARAQDNLRTGKLQAALTAAGIETGREAQRAENVFTFEGQELNRDIANQNFYAVTQSQKLDEVKNDQGNTLAERGMEIREDYLALDEKKQADMLKQFEAEFGLAIDKEAFDQMIEKGEFDLSVIDSDRTYQLQATQQINDFLLASTDLEIQDKLGIARIDLERWVAGERIDIDTVSNAIRRMAVQNQHDINKAQLEVMLAEIESGGDVDWLNFTADLLPILGFVFGGPPGAAAGAGVGEVIND